MQITDPVADMLTRIRNANSAKHDTVDVPASNLKKDIAICTTATTDEEAKELLTQLGAPFHA